MTLFEFLKWVLESFWRTVGLIFIIAAILGIICDCISDIFKKNKQEKS